jgi:hypothetical protein
VEGASGGMPHSRQPVVHERGADLGLFEMDGVARAVERRECGPRVVLDPAPRIVVSDDVVPFAGDVAEGFPRGGRVPINRPSPTW